MSAATSAPARRLARPRWLDPRLAVGLLLVLVPVALGSRLVGAAEDGNLVWAAARSLPAGTTLQADDLEATSVRLGGATAEYVDATTVPPTGYVLVRDVAVGELVPAAAVQVSGETSRQRLVSVPVDPNHFPAGLTRGSRVDVYVTTAPAAGATSVAEPELVLAATTVSDVDGGSDTFGPSTGTVGVVLEVDVDDAAAVVSAVASGTIQLVRLPGDR